MRVGIDVGGTFTDFVVIDDSGDGSGPAHSWKVPSTPGRENEAMIAGLESLIGKENAPPTRIIHGTTVATNTVLQRNGAKVALVTNRGFRDAIEIGRTRRNKPNSQFDVKFVKPDPLVDRPFRFEIGGRIGPTGEELERLDPREIDSIGRKLAQLEVQAVAVCLLNAYVNSEHEREVFGRLERHLKGAQICTSSDVYAGFQESERFSTAALNAYLMPVMSAYLDRLEGSLLEAGLSAPLLVMGSNGGTMTVGEAASVPVRTIVSGPAGGVIAAASLSDVLGLDDIVTYDMGGTSTDVSVIRNGRPMMATQAVVDGLPTVGSMLEISTVGAGAGSIARVESDGSIQVGPESAGADPGPVCYGRGGTEPTVTDANVVLGRLNEGKALGGRIIPDRARAEAAFAKLAENATTITTERLAEGIIQIAVSKMTGAIREISVERGLDPRGFTLVAYGGAGPMHAALVARELGIRRVMVPRLPGNFSAYGLHCTDMRKEYLETVLAQLDVAGLAAVSTARDALVAEGRQNLTKDGFEEDAMVFETSIDMRFVGQAAIFRVPLPDSLKDPEELKRRFLEHYEERYGHANTTRLIEIEAVRVVAIGLLNKPIWRRMGYGESQPELSGGTRDVVFDGVPYSSRILERDSLGRGFEMRGPAIVEEDGSTTVVPPGWRCFIDDFGNLHLLVEK